MSCNGACHTEKRRSEEEQKALTNRLNRIEGQIRGIKAMIERDAYCVDVLTQVGAANAALNAFTRELLAEHIRTCVTDDIREGREDTVDELVMLLQRLMK
ncbi:MAG: metal-sensing transcriptional repressor [Clostridia bacterium]|nr:metal-sensing transcriptional repressor [Clostridia bacterium]